MELRLARCWQDQHEGLRASDGTTIRTMGELVAQRAPGAAEARSKQEAAPPPLAVKGNKRCMLLWCCAEEERALTG